MNNENKTHYRKAFNSPYLSSADIVGPTILTILKVVLSGDQTKKTKDQFNTAYFAEKQLRQGEPLKPMILNAINSKTLYTLTGSHFIEDWVNVPVTVYVDNNVRFGRDTVEGLRISPQPPATRKQLINRENQNVWCRVIASYKETGNFSAVLEKAEMLDEDMQFIVDGVASGSL